MLDRLDLDTEKPSDEELARKFGFEENYYGGTLTWWQKLKPKMWSLFDEPYSSNAAKVCNPRANSSTSMLFIPSINKIHQSSIKRPIYLKNFDISSKVEYFRLSVNFRSN